MGHDGVDRRSAAGPVLLRNANPQLSAQTALSWKWNTEPLCWGDKCSVCAQPLRAQQDGGIVIWTDSKHYHVSCLLDRLASAAAPGGGERSTSHWGMVQLTATQRRSHARGISAVNPIPAHEIKCSTWYYGVQCACQRLLAMCEDCFAGKGDEHDLHLSAPFTITCECGAVTETNVFQKFKTP